MNLVSTISLLMIAVPSLAANVSFKAEYRPVANIFMIMDCVSGWWEGTYCTDDGAYQTVWKKRFGISEDDKKYFARYDAFRKRYFKGVGLPKDPDGPYGDGIFASRASITEDPIAPAFYSSESLSEAYSRLEKIVSSADLDFIKSYHSHFEKNYSVLLEESMAFKTKAKMLDQSLSQKRYGRLFERISRFYSVDENIDYTVLFTWWPPIEKNMATPVDRFLIFNENPIKHIGAQDEDIVFHEVVHTLSKRQPMAQKDPVSKAFLKECPIDGYFPKGKKGKMLEEPLAVALGQGLFLTEYFPERLNWESKLYNDPWVSLFAKLIFPLVKKEVDQGKPLTVETGTKLGKICQEFLHASDYFKKKKR